MSSIHVDETARKNEKIDISVLKWAHEEDWSPHTHTHTHIVHINNYVTSLVESLARHSFNRKWSKSYSYRANRDVKLYRHQSNKKNIPIKWVYDECLCVLQCEAHAAFAFCSIWLMQQVPFEVNVNFTSRWRESRSHCIAVA